MKWTNFFAELQRRNVYKVAVAYAVVSWLLIQIATQVFPFFEIPNWIVRLVIVLLGLGFPVALVLAWVYEFTPERIRRTEEVTPNESIRHQTGRRILAITVVLVLLGGALFSVHLLRPPSFEAESAGSPEDAPRHAWLGLLYAYLGRQEDAEREGRRAVELQPEAKDASDGPSISCMLALILARTNQPNESIPLIQRLLTTPEAVDNFEASITLPDLRQRWQWDSLRSDPRFARIIAGPEPKTRYH